MIPFNGHIMNVLKKMLSRVKWEKIATLLFAFCAHDYGYKSWLDRLGFMILLVLVLRHTNGLHFKVTEMG